MNDEELILMAAVGIAQEVRGLLAENKELRELRAEVAALRADNERLADARFHIDDAWERLGEQTRRAERAEAERDRLRQRVEAAADEIERQVTAFLPDGADHCERAANDAFRLAANIARAALAAAGPEPGRTHKTLTEVLGLTDEQVAEQQQHFASTLARIREAERQAAIKSRGVVLGDSPEPERPTKPYFPTVADQLAPLSGEPSPPQPQRRSSLKAGPVPSVAPEPEE